MKHNLDTDNFFKVFLSNKLNATAEHLDKIDQYCTAIKEWSRRQNIVSRHDLDHLFEKHVMPSVFVTDMIRNESAVTIADIGSGSGFPGIIIKILLPEKSVFLIDSSRKKYLFLLELCEKLMIACQVINTRIEDLPQRVKMNFDLIVSRAVAPVVSLWAWSEKSLAPNGSLCVLKGGNLNLELKQVENMNLDIKIIRPDAEWQNIGDVVKDKFIVRVRRQYSHG